MIFSNNLDLVISTGMFSPLEFDIFDQMNTSPGNPEKFVDAASGRRIVQEQQEGALQGSSSQLKISSSPTIQKSKNKKVGSNKIGTILPLNFEPRAQDVICGRGLRTKNHPGNKELKQHISLYMDAYSKAESKFDKTTIVSSILDFVHQRGGMFVKKIAEGEWVEVSEELKRDKIGQAFRDSLHSQYRSSTRAKRRRWKQEEQERGVTKIDVIVPENNRGSISEQIQQLENAVLTNNAVVSQTNQLSMNLNELGGALAPEDSVTMLFHDTNRRLLDTIQSNPELQVVTTLDSTEHSASPTTTRNPHEWEMKGKGGDSS